jgi:hypothetical protein
MGKQPGQLHLPAPPSSSFVPVPETKKVFVPRESEEVPREILVSALPSPPTPPPHEPESAEDTLRSALISLQRRSKWMDIEPLSSVALTISTLPIVGLQYYFLQVDDNLGSISHHVRGSDDLISSNLTRVIVVNEAKVSRRVMLCWL